MYQTIQDIETYTIHKWMREELNLKGNKRDIYAIIYQQSQGGGSYNGTTQALANVVGISKRQVITILQELVAEGLLIKKEHLVNKLKYCEYWAVRRSGEKTSPPEKSGEKTSPLSPKSGEKTSPYIYIYNNYNTLSKKESEDAPAQKPKRKTFNQIIDEKVYHPAVRELLGDFIQMRTLNNKKLTNKSLELLIEDLYQLSNDPNVQIQILRKSIKNSWTELYPLPKPKEDYSPPDNKSYGPGFKNFSQRDINFKELEAAMFGMKT